MTRRLIVVSIDALVYEDLDHIKHLPCISKFWNEGSRVTRIRTIYPSLTYPAHTSILTGATTGKHTVINNGPFNPGSYANDWFWFHDQVKAKDIHDVAKEAGLTTCSLYWPVTGNHKSVDYLIDEYWPQFKGDTLEAAYKRAGTSDELYELVRPRESSFRSFDSCVTDEAETEIACEVIKKYKPHLLTLHLTQVDSMRHDFGVFNDKVEAAVATTDKFMGKIMDACKEAGTYDETNFIITSDHGQIHYTRKVNLNKLFIDEGLIRLNEDGSLKDWDAYFKSACFSAHVYLKNPNDKELYTRVSKLLNKWVNDHTLGLGEVYTTEEVKEKFGLYGDFSFVIETDQTTYYSSKLCDPFMEDCPPEAPGYGRATHGHNPDVGAQPVFLAYGPQIKKGVVIPKASIIDEAPTMAKILGLNFPEAEGKPIMDFLK